MRISKVTRKTNETDIAVELNLDGTGKSSISTGIGFFDHMLTAFATHGSFDLKLSVKGDLEVDCHHTIEDVGIVLGQAFKQALKESGAINRYGSFYIPMDEALAFCSIDLCGRAYLVFNAEFNYQYVGTMETCMTEEFFRAFSNNSGSTLHINMLYGTNDHHKIEAIFKAAAHAMNIAVKPREEQQVLSTKGVL